MTLQAYCNSVACCGGNTNNKGVIKDVPPRKTECPQCKSILIWRKGYVSMSRVLAQNTAKKKLSNKFRSV